MLVVAKSGSLQEEWGFMAEIASCAPGGADSACTPYLAPAADPIQSMMLVRLDPMSFFLDRIAMIDLSSALCFNCFIPEQMMPTRGPLEHFKDPKRDRLVWCLGPCTACIS